MNTEWRVLVLALEHDYGVPSQGPSFEAVNLVAPLRRVAPLVTHLDPWALRHAKGPEAVADRLRDALNESHYDAVVFAPFQDEVPLGLLQEVTERVPTVAYLYDEAWRPRLAQDLARVCTYITTSAPEGRARLAGLGVTNALFSPFGFNPEVYTPVSVPELRHEVTFVGRADPYRRWLVERIRRAGFRVEAWGHGWPNGRLSTEDMVKVFRSSRVNLNLSNNLQWDPAYLAQRPIGLAKNLRAVLRGQAKTREMVKGRHFEIAACGGYQLSYCVPGLETFFDIGTEVAVYQDRGDLLDQIHHALTDEPARVRLAEAGCRRAWAEHTMDQRLERLLETVTETPNP